MYYCNEAGALIASFLTSSRIPPAFNVRPLDSVQTHIAYFNADPSSLCILNSRFKRIKINSSYKKKIHFLIFSLTFTAKSFDYQLKDHIPKSNKEPNDYTEENVLYIVVLVVFMFAVTACLLLHWKLRKMMKLHSGTIVSITPGSGTPERGTINYSVLQQQPQQQRHCNRIRYPTTCVPKVVSSEDTHLGLQIHV